MSTLEDLDDLEQKGTEDGKDEEQPGPNTDAVMEDANNEAKDDSMFDAEILHSSTRDINMRKRLLENDMRIMKSEFQRLSHEQAAMKEKIRDNLDKIENNRQACTSFAHPFRYTLIISSQAVTIPCGQRRRAFGP